MKAPRLREQDHRITAFLIRVSGNPWSMLFVITITLVAWRISHIDLLLALGGFLIGQLDILSNQYQEVSADTRQQEIMDFLDKRNTATLERLESIEHTLTFPDEPKHS